ncbi:MAG: hypothetical protein JXA97_11110 [Anaerolineales bacterium]|nr:hypothetical protein [Anaerolineales bacterium]
MIGHGQPQADLTAHLETREPNNMPGMKNDTQKYILKHKARPNDAGFGRPSRIGFAEMMESSL